MGLLSGYSPISFYKDKTEENSKTTNMTENNAGYS